MPVIANALEIFFGALGRRHRADRRPDNLRVEFRRIRGASVSLTLLPAVDVTGGRAVQLVQGVAGSERVYGEPEAAALAWQRDGAEWVHLVDLDAAFGRGHNRELIGRVVGALDVQVELSG